MTQGGTSRVHRGCAALPVALCACVYSVWDYAYNIGIGYLGTNTPIDHCFECGFEGDFEPTEEGFKCPNLSRSMRLKRSVSDSAGVEYTE